MKQIRVFLPEDSQPCAYLEGQASRSLYVDPRLELDQQQLTLLSLNGFRRSGKVVYRPQCKQCQACTSVRIDCQQLQLSKSQKRVLRKNRDLTLVVETPDEALKHYPVFQRYIDERHADGDMYPASFGQYREFLIEGFGNSRFLSAYLQGQYLGSLVFDIFEDGLSSVYCFFDPDESRRSPATWLIISLSLVARSLRLPYNYLGYFVEGCQKMDYKNRFAPLQGFIDQQWRRI